MKDLALKAFLDSFIKPKIVAPKWFKGEQARNKKMIDNLTTPEKEFYRSLSFEDAHREEVFDETYQKWERILSEE